MHAAHEARGSGHEDEARGAPPSPRLLSVQARLTLMLARAHATHPGAPGDNLPAGLMFARYLDVCLVVASAPFVLLAGMPRLGYAIGAGGWIVLRFAVEGVRRRAWRAQSVGARAALHLSAILGRVWLIALVVLVARFGGSNDDGITAAVVVLAAFTVELAMSFVLRGSMFPPSRKPS